jgi:hypothetical protein
VLNPGLPVGAFIWSEKIRHHSNDDGARAVQLSLGRANWSRAAWSRGPSHPRSDERQLLPALIDKWHSIYVREFALIGRNRPPSLFPKVAVESRKFTFELR